MDDLDLENVGFTPEEKFQKWLWHPETGQVAIVPQEAEAFNHTDYAREQGLIPPNSQPEDHGWVRGTSLGGDVMAYDNWLDENDLRRLGDALSPHYPVQRVETWDNSGPYVRYAAEQPEQEDDDLDLEGLSGAFTGEEQPQDFDEGFGQQFYKWATHPQRGHLFWRTKYMDSRPHHHDKITKEWGPDAYHDPATRTGYITVDPTGKFGKFDTYHREEPVETYAPVIQEFKKLHPDLPLYHAQYDGSEWPRLAAERFSGNYDRKWVYLNGHVGFGDSHHSIMDALSTQAGLSDFERQRLMNYALVNAHPGGIGQDVAWGHFEGKHPAFWRANADRNAIWDAVSEANDKAQKSYYDDQGIQGEIKPGDPYINQRGMMSVLRQGLGAYTMKDGDVISGVITVNEEQGVVDEFWLSPQASKEHADYLKRWARRKLGMGYGMQPDGEVMGPRDWFERRVPWYESPDTGRVVFGKPGDIHATLFSGTGLFDRTGIPQGHVMPDGEVQVYPTMMLEYDPELRPDEWNQFEHQTFDRISPQVKEHLGVEPRLFSLHDSWDQPLDLDAYLGDPSVAYGSDSEHFGAWLKAKTRRVKIAALRAVYGSEGEHHIFPGDEMALLRERNDPWYRHQAPADPTKSWSGWTDADRFVADGQNVVYEPEAVNEGWHGGGHSRLHRYYSENIKRPTGNPPIQGWLLHSADRSSRLLYPYGGDPEIIEATRAAIEQRKGVPVHVVDPGGAFNPLVAHVQPGGGKLTSGPGTDAMIEQGHQVLPPTVQAEPQPDADLDLDAHAL